MAGWHRVRRPLLEGEGVAHAGDSRSLNHPRVGAVYVGRRNSWQASAPPQRWLYASARKLNCKGATMGACNAIKQQAGPVTVLVASSDGSHGAEQYGCCFPLNSLSSARTTRPWRRPSAERLEIYVTVEVFAMPGPLTRRSFQCDRPGDAGRLDNGIRVCDVIPLKTGQEIQELCRPS